MAKNKKAVTSEHDDVALSVQDVPHKPGLTCLQYLMPSISVLGDILIETNDNYHALVGKSQTLPAAKDAGKALRCLAEQYAKVLVAALEYPYDDIQPDDDDELEFEDEDKDDEEQFNSN